MENIPTEEELKALETIYTSDLRDVIEGICAIYCVTPEEMVSRVKSKRLTEARQIISYVMKSIFKRRNREISLHINRSMEAAKTQSQCGKRIVNNCKALVKELVPIINANETYKAEIRGTQK